MQAIEKPIEHDLRLPSKFSDVIMVALEDLALTEKDDRYEINMNVYHSPIARDRCNVCFAGGIMAQCDTTDISEAYSTNDFLYDQDKLLALDHIRCYWFWSAMETYYGYEDPDDLTANQKNCIDALRNHFEGPRLRYDESPHAFKINMETISAIMAEHGL